MVKAVPLELWCQLVSIMYIQQLQKVLHATLNSTHWNTNRPSMFFCRRYIRKFWRRTGIVCDVQCWSVTIQKWKNSDPFSPSGVLCLSLPLCCLSLRHHYCSSQRNSCGSHHQKEGLGQGPWSLFDIDSQVVLPANICNNRPNDSGVGSKLFINDAWLFQSWYQHNV